MKIQLIKLFPVVAAAIVLSSCGRDAKHPGRIYMPDMTYSNAYETYSASTITTPEGNKMSARQPVAGTIPYNYLPQDSAIRSNPSFLMGYITKNHYTHEPSKWQEEFDRAGREIKNPLPFDDDNKKAGEGLYKIHCSVCHGEKGEGNGQIVELPGGGDGPFTSRPPAYATRLPLINDGNMFYVVSYGKNMMGPYGNQLSVKERWQVIHYIKGLAGVKGDAAGTTTGAAAPAEQKTETGKKEG